MKIGRLCLKKGLKKEIKGYKNDQVSLHYGAY